MRLVRLLVGLAALVAVLAGGSLALGQTYDAGLNASVSGTYVHVTWNGDVDAPGGEQATGFALQRAVAGTELGECSDAPSASVSRFPESGELSKDDFRNYTAVALTPGQSTPSGSAGRTGATIRRTPFNR